MTKKYKLTEKYIIHYGVKLFQIQALVSFGTVSSGCLGGYIEKEENLSQDGDAWVSDNAWVSGNAKVCGNAIVSGNALVSGNAWVCDDAWVSGNAKVHGNALVHRDAKVCGDAGADCYAVL